MTRTDSHYQFIDSDFVRSAVDWDPVYCPHFSSFYEIFTPFQFSFNLSLS